MSRFSHSLIPFSLMCSAPNSVCSMERCWADKTNSSWHIPGLTKDADLDHDPKMHLCALHLQRSNCLELISPCPEGTDSHSVCHAGLGAALQCPPGAPLHLKGRQSKKWGEKFCFPTFGLFWRASAPETEGHSGHPTHRGLEALLVSPHLQQSPPLQE